MSTSPERRAAWCDSYAEAWAWRLERVVFRLRDAGLDRDCASTGSSATRNPTASAMRRTVSIVGFASSAVSKRRTTSGLAETRRASSAFVIPIATRCSSSARIRSSTARISARARAYSAAKPWAPQLLHDESIEAGFPRSHGGRPLDSVTSVSRFATRAAGARRPGRTARTPPPRCPRRTHRPGGAPDARHCPIFSPM
jgi:hypothetical protein